jgi:hypothetical protein
MANFLAVSLTMAFQLARMRFLLLDLMKGMMKSIKMEVVFLEGRWFGIGVGRRRRSAVGSIGGQKVGVRRLVYIGRGERPDSMAACTILRQSMGLTSPIEAGHPHSGWMHQARGLTRPLAITCSWPCKNGNRESAFNDFFCLPLKLPYSPVVTLIWKENFSSQEAAKTKAEVGGGGKANRRE